MKLEFKPSPLLSLSMSNKFLAFYIDSPIQAWGVSSKYQRRETESFPSKSGVIGLIASALGIDKHSQEEGAQIKALAELQFAVRKVELLGQKREVQRLRDFHTVGGGYDSENPYQEFFICRKAKGGSCDNAVLTDRAYLTDAKFIVLLNGEPNVLESVSQSLQNPTWGIWFGRKCCLPASPLSPTLGESQEAVLKNLLQKLQQINPDKSLHLTQGEEETTKEGSWLQADQPISYGKREFASRPVARIF